MQVKISAVIITFNEERNIRRCLDSLDGVVDEIVVVDSFSKDKTKGICLEKGVRFIENEFKGHIEQKNFAAAQCQNDYVLSLDADEALDGILRKKIVAIKKDWKSDGYSFNRLTNYCGKWIKYCGWYPDVKLRLWNRRKGRWKGTNPHDTYEMQAGASQEHIKNGDILHYSYYTIEEHITQLNYFTTIAAKANQDKGRKASVFKLLFAPVVSFVKMYFFRLGLLDGYYGFLISVNSSHATFLKYAKLRRLEKLKKA